MLFQFHTTALPGGQQAAEERFAKGAIPWHGVTGGIAWAKNNGWRSHSQHQGGKFTIHMRSMEWIVIRQGQADAPILVATRSAQALDFSSPLLPRWPRPDDCAQFAGNARGGWPWRARVVPVRKRARGSGLVKRPMAPWVAGLAPRHSRPCSDPAAPGLDATGSRARTCRRFGRCKRPWRYRATSIEAAMRLRKARRSCRQEEFWSSSYSFDLGHCGAL